MRILATGFRDADRRMDPARRASRTDGTVRVGSVPAVRIGVFYATFSGGTRSVVERIQQALLGNVVELCELNQHQPNDLRGYSHLIVGSPTYGRGDAHPDWLRWKSQVAELELSDKWVAFFGLGDQRYHSKTFGGALRPLTSLFLPTGARVVGKWSAEGYRFAGSPALDPDGRFSGLVLDEVNQREHTGERIRLWIEAISREFLLVNR